MSASLTIDGNIVTADEGETILQCAQRHNICIPNLCTHPNLPPFGACRICVVEVQGMRGYPTSCTTPAVDGMVVKTNTGALQKLRRNILELMMLEHPSSCLVCDKRELCEKYRPRAAKAGRTTGCHTCNNKEVCEVRLLSEDLRITTLPVPPFYRDLPLERSDPFMDRDLNLCILCGRCVRICKEHHGEATIDFVGRGSTSRIGEAFGRSLKEAGCRFCGSCVDVCPTGSLADRYGKWHGAPAQAVETTCLFCEAACALNVQANSHGRVVTARGINTGVPICVLGRFAIPEFLNGVTRMTSPLVRYDGVQRKVTWEVAMKAAAERLFPYPGDAFALICDTTCTLEDRHAFKKFTREAMKSERYIEIEPDRKGVSRCKVPEGVKALYLLGNFVDPADLEGIRVLIVQDCYSSGLTERADIVFPAALFTEVDGTTVDGTGTRRPLSRVGRPPGNALPEWQIVTELGRAMEFRGFTYTSAAEITKKIGAEGAQLWTEREEAPPAALNPAARRTHFRGHFLEERVRGLRDLPAGERTAGQGAGG